jgi:hypothetical protein
MSRYKIQKVAIGFKVEVVTIPEINDKYICINKDSYLFLIPKVKLVVFKRQKKLGEYHL